MLDNVHVPVENVLGTIGEGHKVAFNILNLGRVKLGARNIVRREAGAQSVDRVREGAAPVRQGDLRVRPGQAEARRDDACAASSARRWSTARSATSTARSRAWTKPTAPRVLKTIETFAVECSINKVATSEALAYVVDEAVQVFGGNGYSREFPVERAYRDARITRIYEGTNEINRLIIPTRLLKNAGALLAQHVTAGGRGIGVRRRARAAGAESSGWRLRRWRTRAQAYGAAVSDEQEVLAHVANIIIESYAIESAIGRAEKMLGAAAIVRRLRRTSRASTPAMPWTGSPMPASRSSTP